ncbi:MAG: NADH-quinone oxidoreductase subunit J [Pseudomonadota bacterium]
MLAAIAFYVFSAITIASAFMVIASRNPVHSVLFLILAFFSAAALFVMMGAEFLGMILVVVYVGAVAVLFLFVVMMLDVDFVALRQGFLQYLPIGAVIGLVVLAELILIAATVFGPKADGPAGEAKLPFPDEPGLSNTEALGRVLYTDYIYYFQAAGLVLFVAMIGAIVLTLRHSESVRRQDVARQVGRTREEAVEIKKVKPGQGI